MDLRNLFPSLKAFFGTTKEAATALPKPNEPKVTNKPVAQASVSKRSKTSNGDQKLTAADRRTANTDLLSMRSGTTTKSTIRDLSLVSPDMSASVWAYQRMVVTKNFTGVAYNLDGTPNPEATSALHQIITRMNYLTDDAEGFTNVSGLHAVGEMLALELRRYGSCSAELVLDKARLPSRIQPISTTQLEFYEDTKGNLYPVQKAASGDINLDVPTFFYESIDQDLLSAYSDSPMEAALQATLDASVEVVLGQATVPRCHCASISYGDIMEITFAGTQAETDTERDFFRFLVREGIPVRIESNR